MSRTFKIVTGIFFTSVVVLIMLFLFLRYQVVKSFPEYNGTRFFLYLKDTVEIYRDEFAVANISAKNETDLMFAAGYVQAQDRLWQMDLFRRTALGRLSEILGKDALKFDMLFRTLNLKDVAKEIDKMLPDDFKKYLEAYSNGVNAYIDEYKGKLPVEFDILDYQPEYWQPEHTILISRLMAWQLNFSWYVDLVMGKIEEKLGRQKALELMAEYPKDAPVIVSNFKIIPKISQSMSDFFDVVKSYKKFFGFQSASFGSNCWVVDSVKSINGKPILANDPHLTLPAPSYWYEMNLSAPNLKVGGFCFPGTPFIIVGHNERIAWGVTNAMIDESDFYINYLDSAKNSNYIYDKRSVPLRIREEIIKIGKSDSIIAFFKNTHHGPVVNSLNKAISGNDDGYDSVLVSMRWTGQEASLEIYAFYLINKAQSRNDFINALKYYSVPGQNFIYADIENNIGYQLAAKIPIRKNTNPSFPQSGWNTDYEWKGYIPFEKLPTLWNPEQHFIASANNKIVSNTDYYITNLYMPRYRVERIIQLLSSNSKFSINDFQRFQLDLFSIHAKKYAEMILKVYESESMNDNDINTILEYFRNWDYQHTPFDVVSSIYNIFFVKLIKNTIEDELGEELFNEYVFFPALPINFMDKLIETESVWFDDIRTDIVETKSQIIRKSLVDAITELKYIFGPDIKNWQWGKLHNLSFKHPLGKIKPLDRVFNLGTFEVGGTGSTLNNGEINFAEPYECIVGPSFRQIVDLSQIEKRFCVITTGQSGQVLNNHYADQTPLWLNGQYRISSIEKSDKDNSKKNKQILISRRN